MAPTWSSSHPSATLAWKRSLNSNSKTFSVTRRRIHTLFWLWSPSALRATVAHTSAPLLLKETCYNLEKLSACMEVIFGSTKWILRFLRNEITMYCFCKEKKRETTKAPSMIFTHPPTTVSTRASTRSCACSHMPAAGVRIHHHFLKEILRKKTYRKYIFLFLFAEKTKPLLPCDPLILGSLAGGCGLLLLLLIIITLYCNRTFRNHNILHTLERFKQSYMWHL